MWQVSHLSNFGKIPWFAVKEKKLDNDLSDLSGVYT